MKINTWSENQITAQKLLQNLCQVKGDKSAALTFFRFHLSLPWKCSENKSKNMREQTQQYIETFAMLKPRVWGVNTRTDERIYSSEEMRTWWLVSVCPRRACATWAVLYTWINISLHEWLFAPQTWRAHLFSGGWRSKAIMLGCRARTFPVLGRPFLMKGVRWTAHYSQISAVPIRFRNVILTSLFVRHIHFKARYRSTMIAEKRVPRKPRRS